MEEPGYKGLEADEVYSNEFVTVYFSAASSLLIIKWERQINLEERKQGFLWALDFSIKHKVKRWLIDDEQIFVITAQEQRWVENEWTELVATSGIEKIAVWHPDYYNSLVTFTEFTQRAQEKYQQHGKAQHEVFMECPIAMKWLLGQNS